MPTATLLATHDDITGYEYQIKDCRWGITTSTGNYNPTQRFDPPMHWNGFSRPSMKSYLIVLYPTTNNFIVGFN